VVSWRFNYERNVIMTKTQIEMDGITIEILRKPIKNMHLRIYPPDGQVRVSAPLQLSLQHIQAQLESKREWLHTQRARLQALPVISEPTMQTGEPHFFLGQAYPLSVIEHSAPPQIILKDNVLLLSARAHSTSVEKHSMLKLWYKKQMQSLVPSLIEKWQPLMGVTVEGWGTKAMKTRWGSCNTHTRHIWLNLVLIQKPIACLEYVLIHEMVHLLEASHNTRFYYFMDKFLPEWRAHQKELYASRV
jgi:predicted metal-dependent hydrolase